MAGILTHLRISSIFVHRSQKLEEERNQELDEREQSLFEEIRKHAHLSAKETDRLMKRHQEELQEMSGVLKEYLQIRTNWF